MQGNMLIAVYTHFYRAQWNRIRHRNELRKIVRFRLPELCQINCNLKAAHKLAVIYLTQLNSNGFKYMERNVSNVQQGQRAVTLNVIKAFDWKTWNIIRIKIPWFVNRKRWLFRIFEPFHVPKALKSFCPISLIHRSQKSVDEIIKQSTHPYFNRNIFL